MKIVINEDRDTEVALRNLLRNTQQLLAHSMNQCIKNSDYQTMVDILTAWPSKHVADAKEFYEQGLLCLFLVQSKFQYLYSR